MEEFEYYVIDRSGNDSFPLINESEHSEHTTEYIYDCRYERIENPQEMEFVFAEPYFSDPVIGDYFAQPDSVVSKKIADVLMSKNIKGIQLIPATVTSNKGDIYEDYYYIHMFNYIKAMDKEKSKYKIVKDSYFIKSIELDKDILKDISLEDRLVFRLVEDSEIKLFHKSVVDEIMKTNPIGVTFTQVEKWRF